jgi:exodeoxyribonuclease VII small subunit
VEDQSDPRTFEAAFVELQEAVDQLEQGGLPLDRSLDLFEHSMALVQRCHAILDQAELRLTRLVEEQPDLLEADPPGWSPALE